MPPGFGVQLVGLDGELLQTWGEFVRALAPRASGAMPAFSPGGAPAPKAPPSRRLERRGGELRLVFGTRRDLTVLSSREVLEPDCFVATNLPLPAGTRLRVEAEHPETFESFSLDVTVKKRAREGDANGVAVDFAPLDAKRRAAFASFAGEAAEELLDEDIEIDEG